jgi:beta-lactamase regulating signal transducer with metallopeptidase domain
MSTFAVDATSLARVIATLLAHFLWQGAAIGLVTAALLRGIRRSCPDVRYTTALVGFGVMAMAPAVTAVCLALREAPAELAADVARPVDLQLMPASATPPAGLTAGDDLSSTWRRAQPWCAAFWVLGVCVMGLRLTLGWRMVRRLQRSCAAPDGDLPLLVARLTRALGLRRPPRIGLSRQVREAMVVGVFRPLVLVPAAWLIELPPGVLEAVLAHELAHVRRWDPWVNAFQRFVETLLFFHPAVWWLSRRVRVEREFCCDAAAIRVTGEPVVYAQTLELVARRRMTQRVPLFASGIGDPHMTLLQRVKQALGRSGDDRPAGWLSPLVATLLLVAGIAVYRMAIATGSPLYAQEGERERDRDREESPEREGAEREGDVERERERREDRDAEERARRDEARRQQELAERAALEARDQAEQGRREAGEVIRRLEMEVQELRRALEEAHRRAERQAVETQMQAQQRDLEAQRRALDAEFQATAQRGLEQAGRERARPPRVPERPDAPRPPDRPNVPRLPEGAEGAEEPRRRVVVEFERMETGRVPTEAGPQIREELNDLRNQVRELSEAVRNLQRSVEGRGPDAPRGPEGARGPDGPQPPFGRGFPGFGPMRFGEERRGEGARRPGRDRPPEGDRRPEGDRPDADRPAERDRPGADRAPERDRPDGGDRPRGELPDRPDRRPDGDRRPDEDGPRGDDRRPDRDRPDGAAAVTPPGASGNLDDVAATGVVRVYQLKEALAGDVVRSIEPIVVGVQAAADERTNSVIVSGTPEQHQTIEVFVRSVDRAPVKDAAPAAEAVEGEQASEEPSADDAGAAAKPEEGESPEAAFEQDVSEDMSEKEAD